jgi:hypothetical protein
MRPTDITGDTSAAQKPDPSDVSPYFCSSLAAPPITPQEARSATHSICCVHNGLVRETGDVEGRVFWCPIGGQAWRYTRYPANAGMYASLDYPADVVI